MSMIENIEAYYSKVNLVFSETYEKVLVYSKDKIDAADNVIDFLVEAMRLVSKHEELHGFEKKSIVLDVVTKIIEHMEIENEDKERLRKNVAPHLSNIVDFIVAAGKGYLFLQKVKDEIEEELDECVQNCNGCVPKRQKKNKQVKSVKAMAGELGVDSLSDLVYDKLKTMVVSKKITATNIMGAAILSMQLVNEYPSLEGYEKKNIVKNTVRRLVKDAPIPEDSKFGINAFLDATLDKTIDFTISVAHGDIDILGKIEEAINQCIASCC